MLYYDLINYCKKHIGQCVFVVFSLVLAFGFFATQFTFHIDMLVDEYYNGTALIGAGRFSAPLINYFTNWMQFAPFWHTVVMSFILFVSGLIFGLLFQKVSDYKINNNAVLCFWIIFSTFPIICSQLTFPVLSVVLPYIIVGYSFHILLPILNGEKTKIFNVLVAILLLVICIDMYESYATVFLTVFFAVLFIKVLYNNELKFKYIIYNTLKFCAILFAAIVLDWIVSKLFCFAFCGTFDFWYSTNTSVAWTEDSIITTVRWLMREFIGQYLIAGVTNYSIFMFDVAVFGGLLYATYFTIKHRSVWCLIIYLGVIISSLSLGVILGSAPEYRMAQAVPVLVSFFIMLLINSLPQKQFIKSFALCVVCVLVLNQTLYINRYTVINYERHTYENNILENISEDLEDYSVDKKPVVFVYDLDSEFPSFKSTPLSFNNPLSNIFKKIMFKIYDNLIPNTTFKRLDARFGNNLDYDLTDSEHIAKFFNEDYKNLAYTRFNTRTNGDQFVPEIYSAFDKLGCELLVAEEALYSKDDYIEFCQQYNEISSYPDDGYILEKDNLIIVKIY